MIIETRSAKETYDLGKKIGSYAKAGEVYTLVGDLGVGKTVFTQGLAKGLGIEEPISSPTFTIVQVYDDGRLPFYHLMCIGLVTLKRWTRLVLKTMYMETV